MYCRPVVTRLLWFHRCDVQVWNHALSRCCCGSTAVPTNRLAVTGLERLVPQPCDWCLLLLVSAYLSYDRVILSDEVLDLGGQCLEGKQVLVQLAQVALEAGIVAL